jgi:hypothetical protein
MIGNNRWNVVFLKYDDNTNFYKVNDSEKGYIKIVGGIYHGN